MERSYAMQLVKTHMKNKNLIKHVYAAEAVMGALARRLGQDEDTWRLAGLLHDLDYETTQGTPELHGIETGKILSREGLSSEVIHAVKAHNEATGAERMSDMDKALYCADPVTGLIVACALVKPGKTLAEVDTDFVLKKMKEKSFAKGASREQIQSCAEIGLALEDFIGLSVRAMQEIAPALGL
jgi:putative nucleotidyltransferase with HDIG domain